MFIKCIFCSCTSRASGAADGWFATDYMPRGGNRVKRTHGRPKTLVTYMRILKLQNRPYDFCHKVWIPLSIELNIWRIRISILLAHSSGWTEHRYRMNWIYTSTKLFYFDLFWWHTLSYFIHCRFITTEFCYGWTKEALYRKFSRIDYVIGCVGWNPRLFRLIFHYCSEWLKLFLSTTLEDDDDLLKRARQS